MTIEPKEEPKVKYPRAVALALARELVAVLKPHTERIIVAGSLRRRKQEVGDVEILYIPRRQMCPDPGDLFGTQVERDVTGVLLDCLVEVGWLAKRINKKGGTTWGPENKLAVHTGSGIPVDFFATDALRWWNALVVRTGPLESNKAIASAAIEKGWSWHAYGAGFSRGGPMTGREYEERTMRSEEEVFQFVGLPFLPPEARK